MFLAACYIVLTASGVWAAQPVGQGVKPGTARGVAHYIMGYQAELQGAMGEAAKYYEQSVRHDGAFAARMRLAMAYAQLGRYADATRVTEGLVSGRPMDLEVHYLLAFLYSQQAQEEKAVVEYEYIFKALAEKEPGNSEFPNYLGQLYYSAGKEDQAFEQFALALKLDPKNSSLLYVMGVHYLEKNRKEEGAGLLKQCLAVEPDNAECLNSLAYAYAEDKVHLAEALKYADDALGIEPNNAAYLDTRGWIYFQAGRYEEALKELMRADGMIKDPVILEHLAQTCLKLGLPAEAAKYQQEGQALDEKSRKGR